MRPMRTAVVGFGSIADTLGEDPRMRKFFRTISHAEALSKHPMYEFGGVLDPRREARERARQYWNVDHVCVELNELLAEYDPEILVMTCPPEARLAILSECKSLKGVLLEKPLGFQATEIEEWARKKAIPVQVNYWRRAVPEFHGKGREQLLSRLGTAQAAFGVYGNGLQNNGSHLIDMARMLFGGVRAVQALDTGRSAECSCVRSDFDIGFCLSFESNLKMLVLPLSFAQYREVGLDIWGTDSRVSINQESLSIQIFPKVANRGLEQVREIASDKPENVHPEVGDVLDQMYENLYQAVSANTALLSPIESAVRTEAIISAIEKSARSERIEIVVES